MSDIERILKEVIEEADNRLLEEETGEVESVFYDKDWYVDQLYCVNGQFYACMAKTSFGKMVDKDGDGMWEFEIFEWDKDGVTLGP